MIVSARAILATFMSRKCRLEHVATLVQCRSFLVPVKGVGCDSNSGTALLPYATERARLVLLYGHQV